MLSRCAGIPSQDGHIWNAPSWGSLALVSILLLLFSMYSYKGGIPNLKGVDEKLIAQNQKEYG